MQRKNLKVGMLIVVMAFGLGLFFGSCSSVPSVALDRTLMNSDIPIEEQSQILVIGRIGLTSPIPKDRYNIVYILPSGNHTFSGEYTWYRWVPSGRYRVAEPAGTVGFSISYDFLPGQFYYLVGAEEIERRPERIMILTEEELSLHFGESYVNTLKSLRVEAAAQN